MLSLNDKDSRGWGVGQRLHSEGGNVGRGGSVGREEAALGASSAAALSSLLNS